MIVGNGQSRRIGGTPALMRRVAASALLASGMIACQTYRAVPAATVSSGSARQYAKLRVMKRDGSRVEIVRAYIRRDSVVGFVPGKDRLRRVAFAHDEVVLIESPLRDALGRTQMPPQPDDGEIAESTTCPMRTNDICVSRPAPAPK
jgi:hypothetical protein